MAEKQEKKEKEILEMLKETSKLYTDIFIGNQTEILSDKVEFWKWIKENYPKNFMNETIIKDQVSNNLEWLKLQTQGKGYEWDFVNFKRNDIKNLFSKYELGIDPTQKGIDIIEKNIFTNKIKNTFQNKAYVSKTNPDLKNTPTDSIVVTNKEKVEYAQGKGYETESFMDKDEILKNRDDRIKDITEGKASISYTLKDISFTMGKAGAVGFVLGIGTETIASYKKWKLGEISTDEYMKKILISGGQSSLTAAGTAGLMIPVSAKIVAMGASKFINFPVAIAISTTLNKIVAPIFARGKYKEYLEEAIYYQKLDKFFKEFSKKLFSYKIEYEEFVLNTLHQRDEFNSLMEENNHLDNKISKQNKELEKLLIKISGGNK